MSVTRDAYRTKQYRVYRNLHNGKYSIRCCQTGLVVGHADNIYMNDVKPVISKAGQQRVRNEKRRNVHAFLQGTIFGTDNFVSYKGRNYEPKRTFHSCMLSTKITYNPYKYDSFVYSEDESVYTGSEYATVTLKGVFVE